VSVVTNVAKVVVYLDSGKFITFEKDELKVAVVQTEVPLDKSEQELQGRKAVPVEYYIITTTTTER
jgi:hypothetical protein